MLNPEHLRSFAMVCETGSFELAAARVGVTPPAISQRMRALSDAVGGALFSRLSPAVPTALGRRLLRHAQDSALLEASLMAEIGLAHDPRPIRIAINADSLETWAIPALAAVEGFVFDVVIEDQDHASTLLRRGEVSMAITASGDPVPGCDVRPLGALRYRAVATPGFKARWFKDGLTPDSLARAPLIRFNAKDALQSRWALHVTGQAVALPSAHCIAATAPFQQAICAGLGWGLNPEPLLGPDLQAGRLVELAPDVPLDTALDLQVARHLAQAARPVADALRAAARRVLRRVQA
ncbi:ArgP/LysG family DNA-binding transcriptional regulator [Roseibaca sp. Y0-43]|uniref:ArgP/LysG family DNA-binding transcriptional regulator n=1 Tax=Roseibaca sp. Y0-43 TaxID=2816854 RepID=UPI001D0C2114|nr:ArgP/LysG family DNA-binding transcriptional regulator [Roseibaca sp. Y0-43]MCC1482269.1 ArgP/LysG family DNA-binding transcriptional regulator [Roseibaca sp. Y0-43]